MTIELAGIGINLLALIGYAVRQEQRITKMETLVQLLVAGKKL